MNASRPCTPFFAAPLHANPRQNGRHTMTAPLRHSDPIAVDVALGDRAYDIIIGAMCCRRWAGASPHCGPAHAPPSSPTAMWQSIGLRRPRPRWRRPGRHLARHCRGRRGSKTYGRSRTRQRGADRREDRTQRSGDRARRRRGRRPRGLRCRDPAPRDRFCAGADLAAGAGRFFGRRQTGINSPQGKNLLGAFHQPVLVVADTAVLDTLSPRQFRAGYAEVAKYGVLGDEAFFAWLETNHPIFSQAVPLASMRSRLLPCQGRDRRTRRARDRERALLNLGHTFGHALEAATGFSTGCFTVKALPSAWCWRRNCRRSSG